MRLPPSQREITRFLFAFLPVLRFLRHRRVIVAKNHYRGERFSYRADRVRTLISNWINIRMYFIRLIIINRKKKVTIYPFTHRKVWKYPQSFYALIWKISAKTANTQLKLHAIACNSLSSKSNKTHSSIQSINVVHTVLFFRSRKPIFSVHKVRDISRGLFFPLSLFLLFHRKCLRMKTGKRYGGRGGHYILCT